MNYGRDVLLNRINSSFKFDEYSYQKSKTLSVAQAFLLFIVINFYWLFKSPHWGGLPSWVAMVNPLVMLFSLGLGVFGKVRYGRLTKDEILFSILIFTIPIWGNVADILFNAKVVGNHMNYVDINNNENSFYGLRTYLSSVLIFLFVSRSIGEVINKQHFVFVVRSSLFFQLIWAIPQALYFVAPDLLNLLPIKPSSECKTGGDCLFVIRATGLLDNPFYFSWFCLSSYLIVQILSSKKYNVVFLLFNVLSMSRGFILASMALFSLEFRKNKLYIFLFGLFCVLVAAYFWDQIVYIVDLRLASDESQSSRVASNLWAVEQIMAGNLFGIGWATNYFTDSTYSYLLVRSGLPGVLFYVIAWFLFYKKMYHSAWRNKYVIAFALVFFSSSFLVSGVESHPGALLIYSLYWFLLKNKRLVSRSAIKNRENI